MAVRLENKREKYLTPLTALVIIYLFITILEQANYLLKYIFLFFTALVPALQNKLL